MNNPYQGTFDQKTAAQEMAKQSGKEEAERQRRSEEIFNYYKRKKIKKL